MVAVKNGNSEVVKVLITARININRGGQYAAALMWAARIGPTIVVDELIKAGADLDHANILGDTALIGAANNGNKQVVNVLITAEANVEPADQYECVVS